MLKEKKCGFAGHSDCWYNIGIEENLEKAIEYVINKGVTIFFDGNLGDFDKKSRAIVYKLKNKYPNIKIVRVLTHYNNKENGLFNIYDETIFPPLEEVYYKQRIYKRNQWIVENSDYMICHIINVYNSGALKTKKYAEKLNKKIIDV